MIFAILVYNNVSVPAKEKVLWGFSLCKLIKLAHKSQRSPNILLLWYLPLDVEFMEHTLVEKYTQRGRKKYTTNFLTFRKLYLKNITKIRFKTRVSSIRRSSQIKSLTHWSRVTHMCVNEITTIGSDNGSSPGRHQAIIWTKARILLIGHLGKKLKWNQNLWISIEKMHFTMSSAKRRPFCLGRDEFKLPWNTSYNDYRNKTLYLPLPQNWYF